MKHNISKSNFSLSLSLVLTLFFSFGCSEPKGEWMMNPPPEYKPVIEDGGGISKDLTPKAEIIFVIDNSKTMEKHLSHISANIDKFVESFTYRNPLKFNLAVLSAYDFRTFSKPEYQPLKASEDYYEVGEFRHVLKGEGEKMANKRFISSDDENLTDLLKASLKIGVQELEDGGPQYEEFFSPIASLYSTNGVKAPPAARLSQRGFFMGPEAFKIIFFVTDANDSSTIDGSDLYLQLLNKVGGDANRLLAFGAIIPSGVNDDSCVRDYSKEPVQLEKFLSLASHDGGNNIVNLCSDFGPQLAEFGKKVRQKTLAKVIQLQSRPTFSEDGKDSMILYYGKGEIPKDCSKVKADEGQCIPLSKNGEAGFQYNAKTNTLHMTPNLELNYIPGASLKVWYVPVNPATVANGKLKRYGE